MDIHLQLKLAKEKIEKLERENVLLKEENEDLKRQLANNPPPPANINQPSVTKNSTKEEKISLFMSLFRGRTDVFAQKAINKSGSPVFYPVKTFIGTYSDPNVPYSPLTKSIIFDHLKGNRIIGIYPLLKDNTCFFLAVDFDKKEWKKDVLAFADACDEIQIPYHIERSQSGNGAHVWFFFEKQVPASLARKFGSVLLNKTSNKRLEVGLDSYDRMFPSQDKLSIGGLGNLIALPFQNAARIKGNSVFVDKSFQVYEDQWSYLSTLTKVKEEKVRELVGKHQNNSQVIKETFTDNLPIPKQMTIELKNGIHIPRNALPNRILLQLQKVATFSNPQYFKAKAKRYSTHRIPKQLDCSIVTNDELILPRGVLNEVEGLASSNNIPLNIIDSRQKGEPCNHRFVGQLTMQQEEAVLQLVNYDNGILAAETGFGKTITAVALIAKNKLNTLIIVDRTHLIEQWKEKLASFLCIPLNDIGQIGGGKTNVTGIIDIATIQSLYRNEQLKPEATLYGQIIVDECHHISAVSFEKVLKSVRAKKVYGLTATPVRKDGLHPIIFMQCGPIRYKTDPKKQAEIRPFRQTLIIRKTNFKSEETDIQKVYSLLASNKIRNELIFDDVLLALDDKRSPIILTERLDHVDELVIRFKKFAKNIIVLSGTMKKKERQNAFEKLRAIPDNEERLLIATGKFIGEGFDDPRLDTLFLTMPIAWKGTLQQYVGRLHRNHDGKEEVRVYDYVDHHVPILQSMFDKRLKGYNNLGYKTAEEWKSTPHQIKLF